MMTSKTSLRLSRSCRQRRTLQQSRSVTDVKSRRRGRRRRRRGRQVMAGHIRRREIESGTRYYPVLEVDGKQRTFGSYKTKRDALAKLREVERQAAAGSLDQENPTFAELAAVWLESIKLEVKASAYDDYALVVRVHLNPVFGKTRIQKVTTR